MTETPCIKTEKSVDPNSKKKQVRKVEKSKTSENKTENQQQPSNLSTDKNTAEIGEIGEIGKANPTAIITSGDSIFEEEVTHSNESLPVLQKRAMTILENLATDRSKPKLKKLVDILSVHGYEASRTNRGLLVNIRDLPYNCLVDIFEHFS